MKLRILFLIIGTGLFLYQSADAQVISLQVNANGNPSIAVNGNPVRDGDIMDLPVTAGSGIRFDFTNIKDKTALVTVKGARENDNTAFSLDSNFFAVAQTIATDNKLNIVINRNTINLNRPFVVIVGSVKFETAVKCTLLPRTGVTGAGVQTPGSQPGLTMSDGASGETAEDKPYMPGSMVYDAGKLADAPNLSEEEFRRIIKFYFPDSEITDINDAKQVAATNPFLKQVVFNPLKSDRASAQAGNTLLSGLSLSSIGGLDVTNIADGLAKFLVKRTKQELSIAFFNRFKEAVDTTEELQVLFPQTVVQLNAIDAEIYNYERYIQNLREAFREDIKMIHRNLPGIIPVYKDFFDKHQEAKTILLTGCYIAGELDNQTHPGDILANYPIEYLDSIKNFTVKGGIQTIQLLSTSLRDTTTSEDGNYWVNISKVRELVNNRNAFRIYLGLVYQEAINKYERVNYGNTTLTDILDQVAANYDKAFVVYDTYKRYVLRFGDKADALNKMIKEYSKPATDSAAIENYAQYFRASVDLIAYAAEASRLPYINLKLPDLATALNKYFNMAYEVTDLVTDITRKNYSSAINHAVNIYHMVRVKPAENEAAGAATAEAKAAATQSKKAWHTLVKYGNFMATVATADNSDEVANAIEAAALPVGSSGIKRESAFNVALNAYVGPYLGFEKIKGVGSDGLNAWGITAPIGVSLSKGRSVLFTRSKHHSSSTLFFSIIDLGAVTAFRFSNDSAEKVPSIELKDIFAPGIFYSHGFGKTPLSVNIGYQVGPLLRKVNLDENLYEKQYTRFSISFCVDIPVFNFYNRNY